MLEYIYATKGRASWLASVRQRIVQILYAEISIRFLNMSCCSWQRYKVKKYFFNLHGVSCFFLFSLFLLFFCYCTKIVNRVEIAAVQFVQSLFWGEVLLDFGGDASLKWCGGVVKVLASIIVRINAGLAQTLHLFSKIFLPKCQAIHHPCSGIGNGERAVDETHSLAKFFPDES